MIKEAKKWIGYLEHKSNDQIGFYSENIGKGGFTIFSMVICRHYQRLNFSGLPWCAVFVHAICIMAFGKDKARKILGKPCAGTRQLARRMKQKNIVRSSDYFPKENDLIFLRNKDGRICHCGIVEKADCEFVISIEGNAVDPGGYFEKSQGGAVARRKRKLRDSSIACYASISDLL